jgi:hypothetical protein
MYVLENVRRDVKIKQEEEEIMVPQLWDSVTKLPSSKNNTLAVSASFIAFLFQQANQEVKKRKKKEDDVKKKYRIYFNLRTQEGLERWDILSNIKGMIRKGKPTGKRLV